VKKSRRMAGSVGVVAAVAVAASGLVVTSVGSAAPSQAVRVAVVTDIGGLNDKGFNFLSSVGLNRAKKDYRVEGRVFITKTAADRLPNLTAAAQQGYGLVIGVGFNMFDALGKVPPTFPNTKFAGVDVPYGFVTFISKLKSIPNLRGLLFKEAEAGCLVGNIAALEAARLDSTNTISGIGANKVPAIQAFLAGYKYCAKLANKTVKVFNNYANDPTFANQAKCRQTALSQIARGSKVVFTAAGQCGLGGLDAAKRKGVWGIGVDADQYFLGKHMLTSATKKVDVSVYETIKDYVKTKARFKGGYDEIFSLKNNGVGYGRLSKALPASVRAAYTKSTNALAVKIKAGKVKPPIK
jgi:basic membrane protein A and related proteins